MNKLHFVRPVLRSGVLAIALLAALPTGAIAGKADAAVRISATSTGTPHAGQPLTVTLVFHTDKGGQPLTARYTTEGGIVLQSPASAQMSSDAEGRASATVTLTPTSDGMHFLNVFATVGGRTRAVSVPLAVGSAATRSTAQPLSSTRKRGGYIELQADESVR